MDFDSTVTRQKCSKTKASFSIAFLTFFSSIFKQIVGAIVSSASVNTLTSPLIAPTPHRLYVVAILIKYKKCSIFFAHPLAGPRGNFWGLKTPPRRTISNFMPAGASKSAGKGSSPRFMSPDDHRAAGNSLFDAYNDADLVRIFRVCQTLKLTFYTVS